jgi:hypothetical protein
LLHIFDLQSTLFVALCAPLVLNVLVVGKLLRPFVKKLSAYIYWDQPCIIVVFSFWAGRLITMNVFQQDV